MKKDAEKSRKYGIYIAAVLAVFLIFGSGYLAGQTLQKQELAVKLDEAKIPEKKNEELQNEQKKDTVQLDEPKKPELEKAQKTKEKKQEEIKPESKATIKQDDTERNQANKKIVTASAEYVDTLVKKEVITGEPVHNGWLGIDVPEEIWEIYSDKFYPSVDVTVIRPRPEGTILKLKTGGSAKIDAIFVDAGIDYADYVRFGKTDEPKEEIEKRNKENELVAGEYGLEIYCAFSHEGPWKLIRKKKYFQERHRGWIILPPEMRQKSNEIYLKIVPFGWKKWTTFTGLELGLGRLEREKYIFADEQ